MSNEEPEEQTSSDSRWEGEDLAGKITFADSLFALAHGDKIGPDTARGIVTNLLDPNKRVTGSSMSPETEAIAFLIVESLPDELMYQGAIEALDVRPYLDAIAAAPDKELRIRRTFGPDQEFVPSPEMIASFRAEQDVLAEEAARELVAGDASLTAAERDKAVADLQKYDPTKVGKKPLLVGQERTAVRMESAAAGVSVDGESSALSEEWSPLTLQERQTQQNGFPVEQFRQLLSTGMTDLPGLFMDELSWQESTGSSEFFPVDMRTTGGPSSAGDARTRTTETVSIMDALTYLEKLPEAEVAEMQKKMAAAGYFNELDDPRPFVEGDAWDPATRQAWASLITESATRNVPVTKLVGQRMQGYQERNRAAMEAQLLPIDNEYLKASADQAMLELVGRQMTVAESRQLVSYLDALRQERAGYIQGGGELNQGIDGPLRGDYGFDESDINLKIQQVAAPEVAGQAGWDTAQKVWQAFDLGDIDTKGVAEWRAQNRPAWMDEEDA